MTAKDGALMSDTTRTHDEERVLGIVEKLARNERLSDTERADLEAALTPVIRSVVAKTVWRRELSHGAYRAKLEDAVQESWKITLGKILPRYVRERGNLFAFVRWCLTRRVINWVKRDQNNRLHFLADLNAVPDRRTVELKTVEVAEEFRTNRAKVLQAATVRDRKIFRLKWAGASYAEIALEMGVSEVAARGVIFRLLNKARLAQQQTNA
jgi:RNA polymerase sigma factor (sigma-70 family)